MKTKDAQAARIKELERRLREAEAGAAHVYHFADVAIVKTSHAHLLSSGVVMTLTVLGGREVCPPVLIRDGFSDETIAALQEDFRRSYAVATMYRPKGVPPPAT